VGQCRWRTWTEIAPRFAPERTEQARPRSRPQAHHRVSVATRMYHPRTLPRGRPARDENPQREERARWIRPAHHSARLRYPRSADQAAPSRAGGEWRWRYPGRARRMTQPAPRQADDAIPPGPGVRPLPASCEGDTLPAPREADDATRAARSSAAGSAQRGSGGAAASGGTRAAQSSALALPRSADRGDRGIRAARIDGRRR
jgi:hypothetical protein